MRFRQHIELIQFLIEKDFKSKFRGSVLGAAWAFLAPTLHYFVICAVVSQFVTTTKIDYSVMFICGALPFAFVSGCISRAPWILIEAQAFYRKAPLPKQVFIFQFIVFEFIQAVGVFSVFLCLGILLDFVQPSLLILASYLSLFLSAILMVGVCTMLSVLTVFFRDVGYLMPVATQTLFFLSPVAYSLELAPAHIRPWLLLNPLTLLLECVREPIWHGTLNVNYLVGLLAWSLILFTLGQYVLRCNDREIILHV